jgi:hypothetical protein
MKRLVLAALLASLSAAAYAKDDGKDPFAACKPDLERLCKSVQPGEGLIMKCMMDNKASASAPCRALLDKKQEEEAKYRANKHKQ